MTFPTLRERVRAVLLDAGYPARQNQVPTYRTGGTFDLISGVGVEVRVAWWDAGVEERRGLLVRFAVVLADAGFIVEDRGDRLYVAEPG